MKQNGKAHRIAYDAAEVSNTVLDIIYLNEYDSLQERSAVQVTESLSLLPRSANNEFVLVKFVHLSTEYIILIRSENQLSENVLNTSSGLEDPQKRLDTHTSKTDIKRTVETSEMKVLTNKNQHDDQHDVHSKQHLTTNTNKRHGAIGSWGTIMEVAGIPVVPKKENTISAPNKRNNMQDEESKDSRCEQSLINCAKDKYEIPQSKALFYRHHAIIKEVQINESQTKMLNRYNAIFGTDTSVLFVGNTSLKRLCTEQRCFEELKFCLQNKVLHIEILLEVHQGHKYFSNQFRVNLEDETIYWLKQYLRCLSFSGCAHDERIVFTSSRLTKILEDTSNRYDVHMENKGQSRQMSLDTKEDLLRRYRYMPCGEKAANFTPEEHLYTLRGGESYTFLSQSKEGIAINERIIREKCKKMLKISKIFHLSGTRSCVVSNKITRTSVLQNKTNVFLSVIHRCCLENGLDDAVTLCIAYASDSEHHIRYPLIVHHGLSIHQYNEFRVKICQISNYCNVMHLHFLGANKDVLESLCQCTPLRMEACTEAVLVLACISQLSPKNITLAARQNVFLSCILVNYMDPRDIIMPEIEMDLLCSNFSFEFTHDNGILYGRNVRGEIQDVLMNNLIRSYIVPSNNIMEQEALFSLQIQYVSPKRSYSFCMGTQITFCSIKTGRREWVYTRLTATRQVYIVTNHNIITFCECAFVFWMNLIQETCSINNDKMDKSVLLIPHVTQQASPSANRKTQGRVEGDAFKHFSSKRKETKIQNNEQKTKHISFKATEINRRIFEKDLVALTGEPLDKSELKKHYVDISHVLVCIDDINLQLQNTSINFNERSRKEIDLHGRKKRNLRQMIWSHLKELPQPYVHREVIVGFLSGEYSKSPGGAKFTSEHEELKEILKRLASDDIPAANITMKYEMLRLCTLKTYPRENKPFASRLVAAGFYYAGDRDQLICYCCAIRKDNWVGGDIPILIHQEMSPNCRFLTKNASVNIPMKRQPSADSRSVRLLAIQTSGGSNQSDVAQCESSLMLPSCDNKQIIVSNTPHQMLVTNKSSTVTNLNVSRGQNLFDKSHNVFVHADSMQEPPPKYPQYSVKNARISSFQGWPEELRQRPEEMAECGFYYAGFSDCVRCFHCGVGLRHWMSEDDPWIEHARWSTSCIYVLKMKGEEFVSLVKMAVESAEMEAARNNDLENHREDIANAKNEVDTTGSTTAVGAVGNATASTSSSGDTEMHKYLLTDAAQSVLDMGYQPKTVLRAIERVLVKTGSKELTAQIILEAVLDIEEEEGTKNQPQPLTPNTDGSDESTMKDGHETDVGATSSERSVHHEIDPEMIMREHRELRDARLCKVCLDNTISVVFLPCGHLVTCADCAPAMRKCPICRTLIKGTVKTFFG